MSYNEGDTVQMCVYDKIFSVFLISLMLFQGCAKKSSENNVPVKIETLKKSDLKEYTLSQFPNTSNRNIRGLGFNKKTGKLCFSTSDGWGEIPVTNGELTMSGAFMASFIEGYNIEAVATTERDVAVYNSITNSIVTDNGKHYKIPGKKITALAMNGNNALVASEWEFGFTVYSCKGDVKRKRFVSTEKDISGLSVINNDIWAIDDSTLYNYSDTYRLKRVIKLPAGVAGLACLNSKEIFLSDKFSNTIYKVTLE